MDEPLWPEVAGRFFVFANILFGETKGMGGGHAYLLFCDHTLFSGEL
jgi:hypothetical protein